MLRLVTDRVLLHDAQPSVNPRPKKAMLRADGRQLRVLVVDDDANLADVIGRMLTFDGWQAEVAVTGLKAVEIGMEFDPDAVVLDVMLPDFNGVEVLRRLRKANPAVCVLFL